MTAGLFSLLVGYQKVASLEVILRSKDDCDDSPVGINRVAVFILLMHLDIFSWMEAAKLLAVNHISRRSCTVTFLSDSYAPGFDG